MKQLSSAPKRAFFFYSLSALIPMGLMLVCLYLLKITPFGDDTLVFLDAESQYIRFLAYLRSVFAGENDLLYTFSKTMGGDMISLAAYYLLSPFNVVFAFFSEEALPLAFTVVVVGKLSACGLSYYHVASRLYGHKAVHLAFSTAYALMAYNTVYCWNIMWLDGVILLPLMSLGLTQLWKQGKWGLYALTIGLGLVTNFYIGYMLCGASVLFCLVLAFLETGSIREKLPVFGKYAVASCIGGFAAAPVWLPALLSLLGGRAGVESQALDFAHTYGFSDLPAKFVSGTLSWAEVVMGQPNVFCGSAVLVLAGLFFFSSGTAAKAKLAVAAVVLVFLASFRLEVLDTLWHGFSPNRAFNYRYSFLFSFVLIRLAHHTLHRTETFSWKSLVPALLTVAALFFYVLLKNGFGLGLLSNILVLLVCGGLLAWDGERKKRLLGLAFTVLCVTEMGFSVYLNWDAMTRELTHLSRQAYVETLQSARPPLDYIRSRDDGFYRIEQSFRGSRNDPMQFQYNGLSHFSSAEKPEVMTFLEKMGFKNCYNIWSYYNYGSTADADALLGVKYVMSPQPLTAIKGYPLLETVNGTAVYENPNALPIAMMADSAVRQVQMESEDYFALHNTIWSGIRGQQTEILTPQTDVRMTLVNLEQVDTGSGSNYYEKIDETAPASVRFEFTADSELPLYAYFTSGLDDQDVFINVNGMDRGIYFHANRWDMFLLGNFTPGEPVTVDMEVTKKQLDFGQGYFYYEDTQALAQAAADIRQTPVELNVRSGSRLSGSFHAEEDSLLLFTIPRDAGWQVKVDGQTVPSETVLDCLLAVPVTAGSHSFELRFLPEGTVPGCILLMTALVAAAFLSVSQRKKHCM